MIFSIIGAYDREQTQSFLNIVLKGGVQEVRILNIGQENFLKYSIQILRLSHDTENIVLVDFEEIIMKDGVPTDVLVFMNSSFDSLEEFTKANLPLVKLIFEAIKKSGVETIKIILGDNNRGLIQHSYFLKLLKNAKAADFKEGRIVRLEIVTLSSIHQMSKTINSSMGDETLRMYPKSDGEIFTYDPTGKLNDDEAAAVSMELKDKIKLMEDVFTCDNSASSYPYIEGKCLGNFVQVYQQTRDWEMAKRDDGLCAREPSVDEKEVYGLKMSWPLFLPDEQDEDNPRLPVGVFTHMIQVSTMIDGKMEHV